MKTTSHTTSAGVEDLLFSEVRLSPVAATKSVTQALRRVVRLTFLTGPRVLLTSRISKHCAVLMALLCAPALLFTSLVTIPGFLFRDPELNTYFYFARAFQLDFGMCLVMLLVAGCAVFSLALPATDEPPSPAVD